MDEAATPQQEEEAEHAQADATQPSIEARKAQLYFFCRRQGRLRTPRVRGDGVVGARSTKRRIRNKQGQMSHQGGGHRGPGGNGNTGWHGEDSEEEQKEDAVKPPPPVAIAPAAPKNGKRPAAPKKAEPKAAEGAGSSTEVPPKRSRKQVQRD